MLAWVQDALKKLSLDEFERAVRKAADQYGESCKIVAVSRLENNTVHVTVELPSSQRRMIIL